MRRKIIFMISVVGFAFLTVFGGNTIQAAQVGPLKPENVDYFIDDIEIKNNGAQSYIRQFDSKYHTKYGKMKLENDDFSFREEPYKIRHFAKDGTFYENKYIEYRYATFSFEKFFDIPTEVFHTRKVEAGNVSSFTIQKTTTQTETTNTVSSRATNYYWECSNKLGYSMGTSINLDQIQINNNINIEQGIKVGGSVATSIQNMRGSTVSYSTVYTENFLFDNSQSAIDVYFALNHRQKFKVYFTTKYLLGYQKITSNLGINKPSNETWYGQTSYIPVGTYVYLLPIEIPYFEVTRYFDNNLGHKEVIKTNANDAIIYL